MLISAIYLLSVELICHLQSNDQKNGKQLGTLDRGPMPASGSIQA